MRNSEAYSPICIMKKTVMGNNCNPGRNTVHQLMFHGHTHRQLAWRLTRSNKLQRVREPRINLMPGEIYVIGIGSVGRPADGPGAAYAIFDDENTRLI
jgi:diadenosine tetraphosphatase ApaH/serine/threonine PP2A family protein phosphatase